MALQTRGWIVAGSLFLALAQSASAQCVVPGEVLDVPVSTRLLMAFHAPSAEPWYLSSPPMSTRLLMTLRSGPPAACGIYLTPSGTYLGPPGRPVITWPATPQTLHSDTLPPATDEHSLQEDPAHRAPIEGAP